MSALHTPGQLSMGETFDNDGTPETVIRGSGEHAKYAVAVALEFGKNNPAMRAENARRLVACWNILDGIPTAKLEGATLDQYVAGEAYLTGMNPAPDGAGFNIGLTGTACQMLGAMFAGQFKGSNAVNFLEVGMSHEEMGPFIVTIQRVHGETPAQQKAAALAELGAARVLLAERNATVEKYKKHVEMLAATMTDMIAANQAAWVEWRRGRGADAAMEWVENGLCGPGLIPGKDEQWATEPQAWYDANKADPFPTCFCGRPSSTLWMGQGFCGNAHYEEGRRKQAAEAAGETGLPLFDGAAQKQEGGAA